MIGGSNKLQIQVLKAVVFKRCGSFAFCFIFELENVNLRIMNI